MKINGLANLWSHRVEQIWWHWTTEPPRAHTHTHVHTHTHTHTAELTLGIMM